MVTEFMESKAQTQTVAETTDRASAFDVSLLDYTLPEALIAQHPPRRRDDARLLVVSRENESHTDRTIRDFPELLRPADLLVLNDTRVLPARFRCRRATGGIVRGLFIAETEPGIWRVMLEGSRKLRESERLAFLIENEPGSSVGLELVERLGQGNWLVRADGDKPASFLLERVGETPLPPYIKRQDSENDNARDVDRERYQTVYARVPGAVAAPTAGLHLTDEILRTIRHRGVDIASITLHVGLGTFKPIGSQRLADHTMHKEWFELTEESARAINNCRARRGRIVAVGTTSLRVLESAASRHTADNNITKESAVAACSGWTDLFIYPPYHFRAVDALLTNFHLPRTTLLALVMAFAGTNRTKAAYEHAIRQSYRFYSYGDAMLIH
jgi:S-adenosylmethionine:tRNA ribosyltransferase-isomerase